MATPLIVPAGLSAAARAFLERSARRSIGNRDRPPALPAALGLARARLLREVEGLEVGELLLGVALPWNELDALRTIDGAPMVLIGLRYYRFPVYLDGDGGLYWRDGYRDDDPYVLRAASPSLLLERLALRASLFELPLVVELDRRIGERLARALGLPPIAEASGPDAGWWGRPRERGLTLVDGAIEAPARPVATLLGRPPELAAALREVRRLSPEAAATVHDRHPLARSSELARVALLPPEDAPVAPVCSETVLPLQRAPAAEVDGVLEVAGERLRVLETHGGRVLVEAVHALDPSGATRKDERRYLLAAARLGPLLGEAGRTALPLAEPAFDPRVALTPDDARARLVAAGVPRVEPLVALEEVLGGVAFGEDLDGLHLGLGAALRPDGAIAFDAATARVRFGRWSDANVLADLDGRLHFEDPIDGTDHLVAEDARRLLERAAWRFMPAPAVALELDVEVGASAAQALGLALAPELSDAARRIWRGAAGSVEEGPERMGAVATRVALASPDAAHALRPLVAALTDHVTWCDAATAAVLDIAPRR